MRPWLQCGHGLAAAGADIAALDAFREAVRLREVHRRQADALAKAGTRPAQRRSLAGRRTKSVPIIARAALGQAAASVGLDGGAGGGLEVLAATQGMAIGRRVQHLATYSKPDHHAVSSGTRWNR